MSPRSQLLAVAAVVVAVTALCYLLPSDDAFWAVRIGTQVLLALLLGLVWYRLPKHAERERRAYGLIAVLAALAPLTPFGYTLWVGGALVPLGFLLILAGALTRELGVVFAGVAVGATAVFGVWLWTSLDLFNPPDTDLRGVLVYGVLAIALGMSAAMTAREDVPTHREVAAV